MIHDSGLRGYMVEPNPNPNVHDSQTITVAYTQTKLASVKY